VRRTATTPSFVGLLPLDGATSKIRAIARAGTTESHEGGKDGDDRRGFAYPPHRLHASPGATAAENSGVDDVGGLVRGCPTLKNHGSDSRALCPRSLVLPMLGRRHQ